MGKVRYAPGVILSPIERIIRAEHVLDLAYKRQCFICGELGPCRHREPEVEMAIAASSYGIGGSLAPVLKFPVASEQHAGLRPKPVQSVRIAGGGA